MAQKKWYVSKILYCEHVGHEVALETQVVLPSEHLPEQPPRIIARRCSNALVCNGVNKPTCAWCGTNPDYRPV
ncbi:MAG TPA: hypothetical protein VFO91_10130 [Anaerolineales bacterium]|nr:hypothetical protein [Anaerolineales bacterium]